MHNQNASLGTLMIAFFKTSRPVASTSCALIGVSTYVATTPHLSLYIAFLIYTSIFLTCAFGFILNDYIDLEKDKVSHKERPMVSGKIHPKIVIPVLIVLAAFSLLSAFMISIHAVAITLLALVVLSYYGYVNNHFGLLANVLVASLCVLTVIYGLVVGSWDHLLLGTAMVLFFFVLGREILLDILDIEGDKVVNKSSVPIKYGPVVSVRIAAALFMLSTILSVYLCLTYFNFFYLIFIVVGVNAILWTYTVQTLRDASRASIVRFLVKTKWVFLLGILGLATGHLTI